MLNFILRRLGRAFITLAVISIIVFVTSRLSGDPVLQLAPEDATAAELAQIRTELGLDGPIWLQYVRFLERAGHGEFGNSVRYLQPAFGLVVGRLPATIELGVSAFLFAATIGILFGVIAAVTRGTIIDGTLRILAILTQSAPSFWIGMMAILMFAVSLRILPSAGRTGLASLVLPMLSLSMFSIASIMRLTRSAMIETLASDYVKFLRSKGLSETFIIWKHALRNAAIPTIAVMGIQLGHLIGGAVIIEAVFNWPGLGRMMLEALISRDLAIIQAGAMIMAIFMISLNLFVDALFGVIDPRIRYE